MLFKQLYCFDKDTIYFHRNHNNWVNLHLNDSDSTLYHRLKLCRQLSRFETHDALFGVAVAQQVDASVPDKAVVDEDVFLMDVGLLDDRNKRF